MSQLLPLKAAASQPLAVVGGKARALGQLMAYGAPVPPGFVVPPHTQLPSAAPAIVEAFTRLGVARVAVRSSAAGEDAPEQSWAGQFESYLNVPQAELLARISDCRTSATAARVQSYAPGLAAVMPVAVIVQAMVASRVAGVLFTANPVTGNRQQIMIEATPGLAEQLVQGEVTPDHFLVDKATGHIIERSSIAPTPVLTEARVAELSRLAAKLEQQFGFPLDIEWAYDEAHVNIVQARPITTL